MFGNCFKCGSDQHWSAQCDTRATPSTRPAPPVEDRAPESTPMPPPYVAGERKPHPPTAGYLAAKEEMGMTADGGVYGHLLTVTCPWCGRGRMSPCVNPATGRRKLRQHEARYVTALAPLPARG